MVTEIGDGPRRVPSYAVGTKGSVVGGAATGEVAAVLVLVLEPFVENENGFENFDDASSGLNLICCTGVTGTAAHSSSCSDIWIGYGRVVMLDFLDLTDSLLEVLRDHGLSLSEASENRLKKDGIGGGVDVGIGGVGDSVGVAGTQARSLRYSDTAVCCFLLMYGFGDDCRVPPGDSGTLSSSHSSLAVRRAASSSDRSAFGVSGTGADVDKCIGRGCGISAFV